MTMKRFIGRSTLFSDPYARTNEQRTQAPTIGERIDLMRRYYDDQYIWTMRKAGLS